VDLVGAWAYLKKARVMNGPNKNPAISNKRKATQNLIFPKPKTSGMVIFQSHWKTAVASSARKRIKSETIKIGGIR